MFSQKWNCYFQNRIILLCHPLPTLIYLWEIYILYFQDRYAYSATGKYVDRFWEYINRSQTHECGNWDWSRAIPRKGIHKWDFPCSGGLSSVAVFPFPCFPVGVIPPGQIYHHQMKCSRTSTLSLSFSPLWFKAIRALLINCLLALA